MATAIDTNDVGPLCMKSGISSSMLLHNDPLPELESISHGLVLELSHFKDGHIQCSFKDFYQWIKCLFGKKWPDCPPTSQAVARSIERLLERYSKLKKTPKRIAERDTMISEFLQRNFTLPMFGFCKGKVVHFSPIKSRCASEEKKQPSTCLVVPNDTALLKQRLYSTTRNSNKRLKRREATISKQKECIEQQRQAIKKYEKQLE